MFGMRGADHEDYGFASPAAMASALAEGEERQLEALEEWLRRTRAVELLKVRDWAAYASLREPADPRPLAVRLYRAHKRSCRRSAGSSDRRQERPCAGRAPPPTSRRFMSRILITSALPYINGVKHLGNLVGSMLPADVHARFQRMRGNDVLFVCATDEHGTPTELAARAEAFRQRNSAPNGTTSRRIIAGASCCRSTYSGVRPRRRTTS